MCDMHKSSINKGNPYYNTEKMSKECKFWANIKEILIFNRKQKTQYIKTNRRYL